MNEWTISLPATNFLKAGAEPQNPKTNNTLDDHRVLDFPARAASFNPSLAELVAVSIHQPTPLLLNTNLQKKIYTLRPNIYIGNTCS